MLKDTISKFFKLDTLVENLTGFVETRVELLKIEVKEDVAKGLAKAGVWLLISLVVLLFVVFVSIAIAIWIGHELGMIWGFVIVSAAYLVIGVILLLSRDSLVGSLEHKFLQMFGKKKKEL